MPPAATDTGDAESSVNSLDPEILAFSEHAAAVKLCLFHSQDDKEEYSQVNLTEVTGFVWHAYLPGIQPGQIYAYRVFGRYKPTEGFRFNPHKLLLDPYSKSITGSIEISEAMLGYNPDQTDKRYPFKKLRRYFSRACSRSYGASRGPEAGTS